MEQSVLYTRTALSQQLVLAQVFQGSRVKGNHLQLEQLAAYLGSSTVHLSRNVPFVLRAIYLLYCNTCAKWVRQYQLQSTQALQTRL